MSVASAVLERFSVARYAQLAGPVVRSSTLGGRPVEPIWPADGAHPSQRPGADEPDVSMLAVMWAKRVA
jgi:hypothetical protein